MPPARALTPSQISAIEICARTMSVLSLLGSCFIISTFICFRPFRKPINRLVFFATWGNILANVATLISTSALPKSPHEISPLCEFQGVLIQWFMMADSLWVFCMATNVFLVFWYGYDAQRLRHLEKWYFLFAYGVPAIPAFTYLILDHHSQTRIIGAATLWCWVAKDVDWMRIAFFYGPVWIAVTSTLVIYIITGFQILRKRALLRPFLRQSQQDEIHRYSANSDLKATDASSPAAHGIIVTREVQHEFHQQRRDLPHDIIEDDLDRLSQCSSTHNLSNMHPRENGNQAHYEPLRLSRESYDQQILTNLDENQLQHCDASKDAFQTTVIATRFSRDSAALPPRPSSAAANSHNAAALAYLKVAFLMFAALFVVWIPSTVNRLYQFIHKDQPSYALNVVSAIVLPLQGAWNATIYIYTTRAECRRACAHIKSKLSRKSLRDQPPRELYRIQKSFQSNSTRASDMEGLSEKVGKQGAGIPSQNSSR